MNSLITIFLFLIISNIHASASKNFYKQKCFYCHNQKTRNYHLEVLSSNKLNRVIDTFIHPLPDHQLSKRNADIQSLINIYTKENFSKEKNACEIVIEKGNKLIRPLSVELINNKWSVLTKNNQTEIFNSIGIDHYDENNLQVYTIYAQKFSTTLIKALDICDKSDNYCKDNIIIKYLNELSPNSTLVYKYWKKAKSCQNSNCYEVVFMNFFLDYNFMFQNTGILINEKYANIIKENYRNILHRGLYSASEYDLKKVVNDANKLRDYIYKNALDFYKNTIFGNKFINSFFLNWIGYDYGKSFFPPKVVLDNVDELPTDKNLPLKKDLVAFIQHVLISKQGTLSDIFLDDSVIVTSPLTANIYGIKNGINNKVYHLGDKRRGLLSRIGFLSASQGRIKEIKRGVHIRQEILCDHLPAPDTIEQTKPSFEHINLANRKDFLKNVTGSKKCLRCHKYIDPIGLLLSKYDLSGKIRDHEIILDTNDFEIARIIAKNKANYSEYIDIDHDAKKKLSSPGELFKEIASSHKLKRCFVNKFLNRILHQYSSSEISCLAEKYIKTINFNQPLVNIMAQITTNEVLTRNINGI